MTGNRMKLPTLPNRGTSSLLPVAAALLALGIFVADTLTDLVLAVPAFYTAVVLMSVRFCGRRGVVLVGLGCIALTLLSDLLTINTASTEAGLINTGISLTAIGTTTYLALKIESVRSAAYEAQSQLVHVARVTTLGELTASIAHEVNQPLAAIVINGNAALRWLANPANADEARQAIERIVKDANRASDIIARVRALTKSAPRQKEQIDINEVIVETIALIEGEIRHGHVLLETDLAGDLPPVSVDRVEMQQVVLNLVLNATEAMQSLPEDSRKLVVMSARDGANVRVSIRDFGRGLPHENVDCVFDAFYTTKPNGMGMGLTIARSIVEAHGGRVSAMPNKPCGAIFEFTLPGNAGLADERTSARG